MLVLLLLSCDGSKTNTSEAENQTTDRADTASLAESESSASLTVSNGLTPKNVDEFFGDFIFSFIQDKHLQKERVRFPLKVCRYVNGKQVVSQIEKKAWKHDSVFVTTEFYTVLFNNEEQMELENSTETEIVDIEKIDLTNGFVKVFHFEKENGLWMLCGQQEKNYKDSPLADFLNFYKKFAGDSLAQREAIADEIRFVTADPENDFGTIEGTLSVDQWFAFKPDLPDREITNIRYGQSYPNPNQIVFVKRGISNEMLDVLTFTKNNGHWKFVSYEN